MRDGAPVASPLSAWASFRPDLLPSDAVAHLPDFSFPRKASPTSVSRDTKSVGCPGMNDGEKLPNSRVWKVLGQTLEGGLSVPLTHPLMCTMS